jgi:hypothetical protein
VSDWLDFAALGRPCRNGGIFQGRKKVSADPVNDPYPILGSYRFKQIVDFLFGESSIVIPFKQQLNHQKDYQYR